MAVIEGINDVKALVAKWLNEAGVLFCVLFVMIGYYWPNEISKYQHWRLLTIVAVCQSWRIPAVDSPICSSNVKTDVANQFGQHYYSGIIDIQ